MANFLLGSKGGNSITQFYQDKKTTSSSASWSDGARIWVNYKQLAGVFGCVAAFNYGFTAAALRKAGNHIAKCSKRNLRQSMKSATGVTGNLLSSYSVRVTRKRDGVYIGFTKLGHHAHLVDQGHEVVVGKSRVHTGKRTKALHFHSDAKVKDMGQAMMIAQSQMQKDLMKRWDKLERHAYSGMKNKFTNEFTTPAQIRSEIARIQIAVAQLAKDQDQLTTKYLDTFGLTW